MDGEFAVRWPAPDSDSHGGYQYYEDGEWAFDTDSGLAEFSNATHNRVPEPIDEEYPFTLTTGRLPDVYNTGVRSDLTAEETLPTARMNPETIGKRLTSFDRGKTVIESRRESVTVTAEADNSIPPGMVWLPIHKPVINERTLSRVDPESDEPNLKQCAVDIRAPTQSRVNLETELQAKTVGNR